MTGKWLQYRFLLKIGLLLIVAGMAVIFLELANEEAMVEEFVLTRARAHFRDIVLTRRWNAEHGGVYVEKRAGIESNPYLQDPDITATNGKTYTLRNPALMTREISELAARDGDYRFHITSLQLKNPDNAADDWERAALAGFAAGEKERFAMLRSGDGSEFRYMAPLLVETACLRCHQDMDYRVGDVRGGISIRFDITPLLLRQQQHAWITSIAVLLTTAGLFLLARVFASRMSQRMQRLSRRHEELVQSIDGIVWEADARTLQFTFVSSQAERLLGFPVADWAQADFWVAHLHPDDRAWASAYRTSRSEQGLPYDLEYRFVAADGHTIWLHDRVRVIAEDGQPTRLRGLMFDVSREHEQREQTRQLLAEHQTILENALVGITYLKHRRVVSCNRRFEEIFGYGAGELSGQSTECLYASRAIFEAVGERAYADCGAGRSHCEEVLLQHKDGQTFWGVLNGRAIDPAHPHEGSIWIFADISERRAAEEKVHKLLQAVEQSPVSIVITSRGGLIEYVNPRFVQASGYSWHEVIGQNPRLLQSGQTSLQTYREMWDKLLAGGEWRGTLLNRRKNGELFWEEALLSPIVDEHGTITHFLGVKQDVTEQRQIKLQLEEHQEHLEDLVKRRTAELTSALEAAKIADQVKDAFLANVSHELRTPLNAVIGLSALALQGSTDARQRQYLEKVGDAGQTLLSIINDLLDLTRIASGKMRFEAQPFSLRQTAARVFSVISHRAAEKELRLEAQIDERLPERLVGDSLRIEQILLNLLNNSIKFTDTGGIILRIIVEYLDAQRPGLLLEVEDSGIGMSESEIARIYRPFVQADLSITRKYGGSGLGLAICKQLVEGMHGLIEVRSRPGEGTCFGVRLTLALATESDLPDGDKAPEVQALPTHYHDARVLVVDDQPLNREIVFDLLAQVGIVPRFAENGLEAINILSQCGPEAFDLVLMDIQMPVIDGLTATRRVRALPGFATLPIAAMTAHTMEHEKQMYLDEGMNDHLGKPFALPSFFALLARWLAHRAEAPPVPTAPVAGVECGSDGDGELSEIGGLDASAARQRFAGNDARYRYWLREFVGDSADFIARLDALLRDREYAAARQMVHAFKGRVGTLGMTELHDLAAALEQFLRASEAGGETDGTPDSHPDNNYGSAIRPQLVQSIERMRVSLQAALGSGRPVTAAAARPEGPMPPAIAALLPLLEASDGGSAAAIAACLAELPDPDWQARLQAALAKAEGFDFEAAKQILAEMIRAPT